VAIILGWEESNLSGIGWSMIVGTLCGGSEVRIILAALP